MACSLGLHESQSRLWENQVGRSRAFWECWRANTVATFPELASASVDDLWLASNQMCPSMIRTEADEATYNLHILLRTELERALIAGELDAADLAAAWRERMRALLGIEPPDDRQGVLQDVHWSAGEFGYFPTYTLGNVYAAQLLESASAELGDLEDLVQAGDFATLLGWLRQNVHRWGRTFRAAELMERITGQPPGADALLRRLTSKVDDLDHTMAS